MKTKDISEAKDPLLPASMAAMRRVAEFARKIAIQTNTDLITWQDGKLVRIPPETLRAEAEAARKVP